MKTGEHIQKLRKERKLSQEEIADRLNITQRAYSKIENNEVQLKLDRLKRIAEILDVEVRDLISENTNQSEETSTFKELIKNGFENKIGDMYKKIISKQEDEIKYLRGLVDVLKK